MANKKPITIKDVANEAGVSVKTVSRFFSGYKGIREGTREKIQEAMDKLEFQPSAAAQALRGAGTRMIAMITDNLTTTPDSFEIIRGVQDVCNAEDKLLIIGESGGNTDSWNNLIDGFLRQRVEAIIVATVAHSQVSIDRKINQCPLVLVNCFDPQRDFTCVLPDDHQGSMKATELLIEAGHQNIVMIGLPDDMVAGKLRKKGFFDALENNSVSAAKNRFIDGISKTSEDEFDNLHDIIARLMNKKSPPTALMLGNDKMAMRAIQILHRLKIKVPEQVSVFGYDDYQLISMNTDPSLSTVRLPYFEMGQTSARLAIEGDSQQLILDCHPIVRESTRSLTL